jgi:hypothetical protein
LAHRAGAILAVFRRRTRGDKDNEKENVCVDYIERNPDLCAGCHEFFSPKFSHVPPTWLRQGYTLATHIRSAYHCNNYDASHSQLSQFARL